MNRAEHNYQFDSNDDISTNNQTENAQQQMNIIYQYNYFPYVNNQNYISNFSYSHQNGNLVYQPLASIQSGEISNQLIQYQRAMSNRLPPINSPFKPSYHHTSNQQMVPSNSQNPISISMLAEKFDKLERTVVQFMKRMEQEQKKQSKIINIIREDVYNLKINVGILERRIEQIQYVVFPHSTRSMSEISETNTATQRQILLRNSRKYIDYNYYQQNSKLIKMEKQIVNQEDFKRFLVDFKDIWSSNTSQMFSSLFKQINKLFCLSNRKINMFITFCISYIIDQPYRAFVLLNQSILIQIAVLIFDQPQYKYLYKNVKAQWSEQQYQNYLSSIKDFYTKYEEQQWYIRRNFQKIILFYAKQHNIIIKPDNFQIKCINDIVYTMLRIIEENWIKSGIGLIKSLLLRAVNVMQPAYFDRLDKQIKDAENIAGYNRITDMYYKINEYELISQFKGK